MAEAGHRDLAGADTDQPVQRLVLFDELDRAILKRTRIHGQKCAKLV